MSHLYEVEWEGGPLRLLPDVVPAHQNVFTLVVGRNGLGKSRLLADICRQRTFRFDPDSFPDLVLGDLPKVIAVSTGVFDRFPANVRRWEGRPNGRISNYTYLGVRRDGLAPSGVMTLLSNASRGLLRQLDNKSGLHAIAHTFDTVGCEPFVHMVFKPAFRALGSSRDYEFKMPLSEDALRLVHLLGEIDPRVLSDFELRSSGSRRAVVRAAHQFRSFLEKKSVVSVGLDFRTGRLTSDRSFDGDDLANGIRILLDCGLIRMMDLELMKIGHGPLSLRRASSGEQCLLAIILGVAGHLSNGSIVLIDEPEISLHPEWQERFMDLLVSAVSVFRGCQFVIATHSPQLVSRLPAHGCFVLSLSRRALDVAALYANKSADVQLAELFDAPGAKNEYLARLAFNLLAQIRSTNRVTSDQRRQVVHLRDLAARVDPGEPIVELVESIVGVIRHYGPNS
ncbi:putative ATPase [Luteibacter jiangsuensis]|uniref:ATPase n=1 Tax=Luteibacter jiangsuensis TaxID=637577 RepID=A0ABT9T3J6_9GAMM|nr:ATP-binding protein [Luteibacter jiangsuensis]MDQ0011545.1 putative ATPase [Luteibacter jiangsuensis]